MEAPWLSVVMPVHNGARDLPATLESLARNEVRGIEFLIYDSSTDEDCEQIVANHATRLPLVYTRLDDAGSWPAKTNKGVRQARAPHVAMLHHDDLWLEGHADMLRASIGCYPEAVMHVGPSRLIDPAGRGIGSWSLPMQTGLYTGMDFGRLLLVQNFIAAPSPVFRRDAWLAVGGMDESLWYTADWDVYLKLCLRGAVAVRAQASTAYRLHGHSLTSTGSRDNADLRRQMEAVLERHAVCFNPGQALLDQAGASIAINCALAAAATGQGGCLRMALARLWRLGLRGALGYLHTARLVERIMPRLRLKLSGVL